MLDAVLAQIDAMHHATADLKPPSAAVTASGGWDAVARDPEPFLSLGLVSKDWLTRSLAPLIDAERNCAIEGTAVTHFDLRSDNICLTSAGVKFVDWAEARLGNPKLDLGFFLPSLCFEGGPQPDVILPAAPEVAAWVSGFFASRAGLPDIPDAPFVRRVQREQLIDRSALGSAGAQTRGSVAGLLASKKNALNRPSDGARVTRITSQVQTLG